MSGAKDHVSKGSICPIPRIRNGRRYGGKGCMEKMHENGRIG
jgi:hypothetical protein